MLNVSDQGTLVNEFVVDRYSDNVAPGNYKARLVDGERTEHGFELRWQVIDGRYSGRIVPQNINSRHVEAPLATETVSARVDEICAVTDFDQHSEAHITVSRINGQAVVTGFFIPAAARALQ